MAEGIDKGECDGPAVAPEPTALTFTAPAHPSDLRGSPFFFGRRTAKPKNRLRIADEDGARRALGPDGMQPGAGSRMTMIEHLARIALG